MLMYIYKYEQKYIPSVIKSKTNSVILSDSSLPYKV